MKRTRSLILLGLTLACATCGENDRGAISILPANREVGSWRFVQAPAVVNSESELYNLIDGGAPKYLERGWVSSTYGVYGQDSDSNTIQVAVHDMGTPENAEDIFNVGLPAARTEISYTSETDPAGRRANAVVNLGLMSIYAADAFSNRYYIEILVDAKTDAALADVTAFALATIKRAQ
jgi:hypothetical protein